jgi:hypothetical protein
MIKKIWVKFQIATLKFVAALLSVFKDSKK